MDLTQLELTALIAELVRRAKATQRAADPANKKPATNDVVEALANGANADIFQPIHDRGFDAMRARAAVAEQTLTTERDAAVRERDQLKTRVAEIERNTPNAETLTQPLKAKIVELEGEITKRDDAAKKAQVSTKRKGTLEQLEKHLVANKIDPIVAKGYLRDDAVLARLDFAEDGSLRDVLRRDVQVPIVTTNGKSALEILAIELADSTPAHLRTSAVSPNGGSGDSAAGAGGAGGQSIADSVLARRNERADRPNALTAVGAIGKPNTPPVGGTSTT